MWCSLCSADVRLFPRKKRTSARGCGFGRVGMLFLLGSSENGFFDLTGQHDDSGCGFNVFQGVARENGFFDLTEKTDDSTEEGNVMTRSVVDLASISLEAYHVLQAKVNVFVQSTLLTPRPNRFTRALPPRGSKYPPRLAEGSTLPHEGARHSPDFSLTTCVHDGTMS